MPNRVIKESIKRSPQIDSLTWFEEVVFYRLIVTADDYGCVDGRPVLLKNELFPTKDNVTRKSVEDAIRKLVSAGLLRAYEVNGMPYLLFPTWEKHQRIRNKRRKYPEPTEKDFLTASCCQMTADCCQMTEEEKRAPLVPLSASPLEPPITNPPIIPPKKENPPTPPWGEVPPGPLLDALRDFEQMRVKIKKPMTPRARKLLLGHLQKLSGDEGEQIAILEQSILNGWQDVYALKGGARDGGRQEPIAPSLKLGTHL